MWWCQLSFHRRIVASCRFSIFCPLFHWSIDLLLSTTSASTFGGYARRRPISWKRDAATSQSSEKKMKERKKVREMRHYRERKRRNN
ncbi:hypothetical protein P8452_31454 [Trifolium repens]|nr:hypothetical protein P8452_31454 [Trifolium repens]